MNTKECKYFGYLLALWLVFLAVRAEAAAQPVALSITAPVFLQSNGRAVLGATVTYRTGATQVVVAAWRSSNPAVATVSSGGILAAGKVTVDTQVTIIAEYVELGETVRDAKTITITAAPAILTSITIRGGSYVPAGGIMRLRASATYADNSTRQINPGAWTTSNAALGRVNARGELIVGEVARDTDLIVTARYTQDGITRYTTHNVTIMPVTAPPVRLGIHGVRGTLASGASMNLAAFAIHENGTGKPVTATWTVANTSHASISASGTLTAGTVATPTPVLVTASYTVGGTTLVAEFQTIVMAGTAPPPLFAEVVLRGTRQRYSMDLFVNANALVDVARAARSGGEYNMYVAALLPAGALASEPSFLLLNRNAEWQALAWPLVEYMSGVQADEWALVELFDSLDASILAGTQIIVGYGISDSEMLEAQRYMLVYQVP